MFSLIITILSIALVALLALATLYYVSDIFSERSTQANAASVRLQGQQIFAAMEIYRANLGAWPESLDALKDADYLKSIPQPPASIAMAPSALDLVLPSAMANSTPQWGMALAGRPHIWLLGTVNQNVCQVINKGALGDATVYERLDPAKDEQCFGAAPATYFRTLAKDTVRADMATYNLSAGTPIPALGEGESNTPVGTENGPPEAQYPWPAQVLSYAYEEWFAPLVPQDGILVVNSGGGWGFPFVVTNMTNEVLRITGARVTNSDFDVSNTGCVGSLMIPGASCTITAGLSTVKFDEEFQPVRLLPPGLYSTQLILTATVLDENGAFHSRDVSTTSLQVRVIPMWPWVQGPGATPSQEGVFTAQMQDTPMNGFGAGFFLSEQWYLSSPLGGETTIDSLTLTGTGFTVQPEGWGTTCQVGGQFGCNVAVKFTPAYVGEHTGTLTLTGRAHHWTGTIPVQQVIHLRANGIPAQ